MFPRKKEKQREEQQPQAAEQKTEEPLKEGLAANVPSAVSLQKQGEELQKKIDGLKKEKDDIFAKLQRVAADYDNYQKRSVRQIEDSVTYEKERIIKTILPVLDNFEYVVAHTSCGASDEALLKGVQIIRDQMSGVLRGLGVEEVEATGKKFDPAQHEAITQRAEAGKEDGVILEELQKGYKLDGRVIRASRVVVNKAPAAAEEQKQEEPETKDTQ